ncbi:MAG: hypothetical protein PWQ28_145 [Candidatus Woesearchaeota archaeon]|nr:hypothetical protein [Candidatus Woesearchaeota archaeon]
MIIDTNFKVYSDAKGGDPDIKSPTLRRYHKILWSKPLPNGKTFDLSDDKIGAYLYHKSELGEFFLGSDAIAHSYKSHKRKKWIVEQIPEEVDELENATFTIGAYIIFPNKKINGKYTINQERGVNRYIDDRFDLTLECIRLFYLGQKSPLYDTLLRYKDFFDLFNDFTGYINFFLLQDLIDDEKKVKFYLPFDNFKTPPKFSSIEEYLLYKKRVMDFINSRNKRIKDYIKKTKIEQSEITKIQLA